MISVLRTRKAKLVGAAALAACALATGLAASGKAQAATNGCYGRPDIVRMQLLGIQSGRPQIHVGIYPHGSAWHVRVLLDRTPISFSMHTNWKNEPMQFYDMTLTPAADHYAAGQTYHFTVGFSNDCGTTKQTRSWTATVSGAKVKLRYVALGDSYSSGEGNPPFTGGACHRSQTAWPALLGYNSTTFRLEANLACSGARTNALFISFKGQPPQLAQLKKLNPDIVTITIGGNDVGFASVMMDCFYQRCLWDGRLKKTEEGISKLRGRLIDAFLRLKQAVPKAKIFVIGYPRIFPSLQLQTHGCGWLEPQERADLNTYTAELAAEEKLAAQAVGLQYVSVLDVFKGHELCTRSSWLSPIGKLPLWSDGHPNPQGQGAIAHVVRQRIG